jgi:CubicO group peptidase (beta-lactamase class C family)
MATNQDDIWTNLQTLVSDLLDKKKVPGAVVGVLHRGEVRSAGFGITNIDHPLPVTDDTLFQIGSITKTFTGTALMRLVEMGKLNLEATVRTYLPEFKVVDEAAAKGAKVRHLLTHMGGWIGDVFEDTGGGDDALARYVTGLAEAEQLAPPGTVWSYNNAGFSVAGYIIEHLTGQSFEAALKELVLEPLGLEHSYLDPGQMMTYRFAAGHYDRDDGLQVARPWPLPRAARPMGGIICSVKDLLRYARFHLGDGKNEAGDRLLKKETLAHMHAPQVTVWGDQQWALTWAYTKIEGAVQLSHGGGTVGQISWLGLLPEHDFAIAIFTNAGGGGAITRQAGRWALEHYLGLTTPEPEEMEVSEEDLRPYVGRYRRPFAEIELGLLGGKLVGQMTYKGSFPSKDTPPPPSPPPASLTLCEPDRLLVLNGPFKGEQADVVRRPDGAIGWLRMGGRIHRREG